MKESTKKKISKSLRRYHSCCRGGGCGRRGGKKKRRVALTQVKSKGKRGKIRKSRAASKGQRTAARLLKELERKAREYDKKYTSTFAAKGGRWVRR